MTNTYKTLNPLGSVSAKDLSDNSSNFDEGMNSLSPSFYDRFFRRRQTWSGMEKMVADFLEAMGFEATHLTYVDGTPLTVLRPTQLIDRAGSVYKVKQPASFPVSLTGTWSTDQLLLVDVGDAALRAILASPAGATYVAYGIRTIAARFNGTRLLKDGGATGDGFTNDQASIEAELAATYPKDSRPIESGIYKVATRPNNPYGIAMPGAGAIVSDKDGGFEQHNTYANQHKVAMGREHLGRVYNVLMNTTRGVNVHLFGDSTVEGGFNFLTWPFFLQQMLPQMAANLGIEQPFLVTNHGVGGTRVTQMDALPYVSSTSDLFIIKYGVNDGTLPMNTRLATFKDGLINKISEIRAATYGAVGDTAILLVGPNSTYESSTGRDAYWYEQLRGIYMEVAQKYQCAYFDTYMYLQDSRNGSGSWLGITSPGDPSNLVHPTDIGNPWIWGPIMDWVLGGSQLYGRKTNNFMNTGGVYAFADIALLPNQYQQGITIQRARLVDGWPEEGALVTTIQPDFICRQELFPFANNRSKQYMRNATTPGNYWNLWTGQRQFMVFSNGWTAFGGSRGAPSALLTADGSVVLSGSMKGGTAGPGVTACTLPAGMRPMFDTPVTLTTSTGTVRAMIFPDGSVQGLAALDTVEVSFGGITIQVAS